MVGWGVGWFGIPSSAQSGDTYKTRLSPLPADAKTRPDLSGVGTVTAALSGTKLTVNGTFEGLRTNVVSAKLHNGITAVVRLHWTDRCRPRPYSCVGENATAP